MEKVNILQIVKQLSSLGMRQGQATIEAGKYIKSLLDEANLPYKIEYLAATIPHFKSAQLIADKVQISCKPTSFISGSFSGNSALVSSLISSRYLIDVPNINFNPRSETISRSNFYFAPSVAIRRNDVAKIAKAASVSVSVRVIKKQYRLPQFLVGNIKNPKTIVFAHFDSIDSGAIDNASGVAVALSCMMRNPGLLEKNLVVFDPHEELSYNFPTYWGEGFRIFERRHAKLFLNAKRIIALDSVGNGAPKIIKDKRILKLALPIASLDEYASKIISIGGDIEELMRVYHAEADRPEMLKEKHLEETCRLLERSL